MASTILAASSRPESRPDSPSGINGEGRRKDEWKGHSKRLCSDWLVSYESNFSVAKDREWFTTYIPFDSYVLDHKGVLMEVFGIGSVTLPVKCSNRFDDNNPTRAAQVTLHDVLHVPKAVCNLVSRHESALGRQELWTLPSEEDSCKRGVFQHQHRPKSKSNEPDPGLDDGDVNVCVYMLPNSGSLCLLDLDMERPPAGYSLAHTSFPVYTAGSPKMLMDTYSGDLIPLTWPHNQQQKWNRKKETDDDGGGDSRTIITTSNTGPSIQTSELVKRLMNQRAGLISQLSLLDMLIDDVQGVTPAVTATASVNNVDTRPMTTVSPSIASLSIVTPATASVVSSATPPIAMSTPSIPEAVDHSGVCHEGGDNTQAAEFVLTTMDEEAKTEKETLAEKEALIKAEMKEEEDARWVTHSEEEAEEVETMTDDKDMAEYDLEDEVMAEYDDIEDELMAEVTAKYEAGAENEDEVDGGVTGQEEIAAPSGSAARKALADTVNWAPLSSIRFRVECEPDRGRYTGLFIVILPESYQTKTWSYDKVQKKQLSEEEKAWLKAVSKYTPRFFRGIGYDAKTDTWQPGKGGGKDRAHARTLVKWLRGHARPPICYGEEIRIDLDAGVLNDCGLGAAKERLRVLRAAGRDPSPEATRELNFIHQTTLRLRLEGAITSYKDDPDVPIWSYDEVFGML